MLGISEELAIVSTKDSSLDERLESNPNIYHNYSNRNITSHLDVRNLAFSKIPGTHVYNNMSVEEILEYVSKL